MSSKNRIWPFLMMLLCCAVSLHAAVGSTVCLADNPFDGISLDWCDNEGGKYGRPQMAIDCGENRLLVEGHSFMYQDYTWNISLVSRDGQVINDISCIGYSYSPALNMLVYSVENDDRYDDSYSIHFMDCSSGESLDEEEVTSTSWRIAISPDGKKLLYRKPNVYYYRPYVMSVINMANMISYDFSTVDYDSFMYGNYDYWGFAGNDLFYVMVSYSYYYGDDYAYLLYYRIEGNNVVLAINEELDDSLPDSCFEGARLWNVPGFVNPIMSADPYERKLPESYAWTFDGSQVQDISGKISGMVVNPFFHDGRWYIATVSWDDDLFRHGKVNVYDETLRGIKSWAVEKPSSYEDYDLPLLESACMEGDTLRILFCHNGR